MGTQPWILYYLKGWSDWAQDYLSETTRSAETDTKKCPSFSEGLNPPTRLCADCESFFKSTFGSNYRFVCRRISTRKLRDLLLEVHYYLCRPHLTVNGFLKKITEVSEYEQELDNHCIGGEYPDLQLCFRGIVLGGNFLQSLCHSVSHMTNFFKVLFARESCNMFLEVCIAHSAMGHKSVHKTSPSVGATACCCGRGCRIPQPTEGEPAPRTGGECSDDAASE